MKKLSCGVIIETPSGVLIGHATNTPHWDVFKGGSELGENPFDAAKRECLEESGLDITALNGKLIDIGRNPYRKEKDLHLFLFKTNTDININELSCSSMVFKNNNTFPEIDKFKLVQKEELSSHLPKNLYNWISSYVYPELLNSGLSMY